MKLIPTICTLLLTLGCGGAKFKQSIQHTPTIRHAIGDTVMIEGHFLQEWCPSSPLEQTLCFDGLEQITRPCPVTIRLPADLNGTTIYQSYTEGVFLWPNHNLNLDCDSLNYKLVTSSTRVDTIRITDKTDKFDITAPKSYNNIDQHFSYLQFDATIRCVYRGFKPLVIPDFRPKGKSPHIIVIDSVHMYLIITD